MFLLKGCWLVMLDDITFQQLAGVSRRQICSDSCMCCHFEIKVADQIFNLIQSEYTATGPTSPSTDPILPGVWQGSQRSGSASEKSTRAKWELNLGSAALEGDASTADDSTTRPARRFSAGNFTVIVLNWDWSRTKLLTYWYVVDSDVCDRIFMGLQRIFRISVERKRTNKNVLTLKCLQVAGIIAGASMCTKKRAVLFCKVRH